MSARSSAMRGSSASGPKARIDEAGLGRDARGTRRVGDGGAHRLEAVARPLGEAPGREAEAEDEEVHAGDVSPARTSVKAVTARHSSRTCGSVSPASCCRRSAWTAAGCQQATAGPHRHAAHQRRGVARAARSAASARSGSPGIADRDQDVAQEPVAAGALHRRAGEERAEGRVVEAGEFGQRRRRRGPPGRPGGHRRRGAGELVPGADREAIVAAEHAVADRRPELRRDRPGMLDGQVGDAAPRIEPVGSREGVGRADVEAGAGRSRNGRARARPASNSALV